MVPVPRAASWEELNAQLLEQCRQRREQRVWGHEETIGQRFERDRENLLLLPAVPLEACQKKTTRASSQALVRFETNDYSVPVAYGHRQVLVKAFVWEVVISCASEVIARHPRSYEREEMIFEPLHYLRCWSRRPTPWTRRHRCRAGSYRKNLPSCDGRWRRGWENGDAASTCRCCGCWRRFLFRK